MKLVVFTIAAVLAGAVPTAPALAAETVTFTPVTDDSIPSPPQPQEKQDGAYDAIARFVRDARFEVAKSITIGENPMLDPFAEDAGKSGQERSSLGDFRLPPNTKQMLLEGGGRDGLLGLFTLSNVPEPSQWTMLILGIGLIGSGLRRRRAVALLQKIPRSY